MSGRIEPERLPDVKHLQMSLRNNDLQFQSVNTLPITQTIDGVTVELEPLSAKSFGQQQVVLRFVGLQGELASWDVQDGEDLDEALKRLDQITGRVDRLWPAVKRILFPDEVQDKIEKVGGFVLTGILMALLTPEEEERPLAQPASNESED